MTSATDDLKATKVCRDAAITMVEGCALDGGGPPVRQHGAWPLLFFLFSINLLLLPLSSLLSNYDVGGRGGCSCGGGGGR